MKLEIEIPEFKTNSKECFHEVGEEFMQKIIEPLNKFFEEWVLPNGEKCLFIDSGHQWVEGIIAIGMIHVPSRFNMYDDGAFHFGFYANGMGYFQDGARHQEHDWKEILEGIIYLLVREFENINNKTKIKNLVKAIEFLKI